jgi:hypothetical protein
MYFKIFTKAKVFVPKHIRGNQYFLHYSLLSEVLSSYSKFNIDKQNWVIIYKYIFLNN